MVLVQRLNERHRAALGDFFESVTAADRSFFKEEISDDDLFERWLKDEHNMRFVAVDDGTVVGYLAVLRGHGLFRHVCELRLVVSAAHRRKGVGRQLARSALREAVPRLGAHKIVVEVPAPLQDGVVMFSRLGFEPEALLRDHLEDRTGAKHDLWLLSHFVRDNVGSLEGLGIDEALGGMS